METAMSEPIEENVQTTEVEEGREEYIEYEERDVEEGVQKSKHSVVGKLITTKTINPVWVHTTMNNIWRKPVGFNMIEIRPKLYQFFFEREAGMRRVLKGNPWTF
ncbi:hypothetical protein Ahy_A02g007450 [Arachis hypogaea]|uniref:DUF4283 domain-containing protein n=1 Tax=Arachis hypogaea TaxID=3818 RepID=A0A445EC71_ARAHY|nr:hypothetical protein Ahy_A02g007450 [Arachis hypogaea]